MLDIESTQTKSTHFKKVIATTAAATLCVGAAVFATTNGASTEAQTALINIPDTFSGSYSAVYDNGNGGFSGVFNKDVDANGDWTLEGHILSDDKRDRFTLKDNKVYVNNTCYRGQRFPTFGAIPTSLDMGVELTDVNPAQKARVETHCPTGAVLVNFMGMEYAVCADTAKNGAVIKALGADYVLSATMNEKAAKHVIMAPEGHKDMECAGFDMKKSWDEINGVERMGASSRRLQMSASSTTFSKSGIWGPNVEEAPREDNGGDDTNRGDDKPPPIDNGGKDPARYDPSNTFNPNARYTCYFFHGVGNEPVGGTATSHLGPYHKPHPNSGANGAAFAYWGDIHTHTKCRRHIFMNIDTRTYGWSSSYIQQEFCNMLSNNGALDRAGNTRSGHVVITHSMGGMTSAAAFNAGTCGIGRSSLARYVTVQAPWRGSTGADEVERICKVPGLSQAALAINGYCKPCPMSIWPPTLSCPGARPAYLTLKYKGFSNGALVYPNNRPDAEMCGTDPNGLLSQGYIYHLMNYPSSYATNPALIAIANVRTNQVLGNCGFNAGCRRQPQCQNNSSCYLPKTPFNEQWNDGMVDMHSCTNSNIHAADTSGTDGGEHRTDNYAISHADGTCMNGNGIWGFFAQPCSWIAGHIARPMWRG